MHPGNLLSLTRAAAECRGTTQVVKGLEMAHTVSEQVLDVAFGSTDSWQDVRRSIRRHGYDEGAEAVLPLVMELAVDKTRKGCPYRVVRVAGHSMGGAVARRLAIRLLALGFTVVRLETYGEPRGRDNPSPIRLPGHRYRCGSDPVPWIWPGHSHPWPATQLPSPNGPWTPVRGLFDHRLSSYERALNNG